MMTDDDSENIKISSIDHGLCGQTFGYVNFISSFGILNVEERCPLPNTTNEYK